MPGQRADGVHNRSMPLHDDLWTPFKAKAAADGLDATGAVRALLTMYVNGEITLRPDETQ